MAESYYSGFDKFLDKLEDEVITRKRSRRLGDAIRREIATEGRGNRFIDKVAGRQPKGFSTRLREGISGTRTRVGSVRIPKAASRAALTAGAVGLGAVAGYGAYKLVKGDIKWVTINGRRVPIRVKKGVK